MLYESSTAYINKSDNVGHLSLAIRDFETEEDGEAEGFVGGIGRMMAEQLNNPSVKKMVRKMLADHDHHLFYSMADDGTEIVCIPGTDDKFQIDDQSIKGLVVASYSTHGEIPSAEQVYGHHVSAVCHRTLLSDRPFIRQEVLDLAATVNGIYEKAFGIMKESGF